MATSGSTGSPTLTTTRCQSLRGKRCHIFGVRRENIEPHNPEIAIGITGTGVSVTMRVTPVRNAAISPSRVSRPSGKMQTSSPSRKAKAVNSKARSRMVTSSFAEAMGMAFMPEANVRMMGARKMASSMMNRMGRRQAAEITKASTKLT